MKLERSIFAALGVIYPCKRQEKRPFITLSFQWITFMESFYCYESGFTPTWRGVKSQIPLSWIALCSLSLVSHQDVCLHYTYNAVTVIHACSYSTVAIYLQQGKQCKSRYLETFIIANIFVSVNLPLKDYFLSCFFFSFWLFRKVEENLHFTKLTFSFSLILLNLNIGVMTAANEIKYI